MLTAIFPCGGCGRPGILWTHGRVGPSAPHFDIEALCSVASVHAASGRVDDARALVRDALAMSAAAVAGFSDPAARAHAVEHAPHHAKARRLGRELGVPQP